MAEGTCSLVDARTARMEQICALYLIMMDGMKNVTTLPQATVTIVFHLIF